MATKFKPPDKVWVSWCKNCGEVIMADIVKPNTKCPYCHYPDDNNIRHNLYVKCSTKCATVGKKSRSK